MTQSTSQKLTPTWENTHPLKSFTHMGNKGYAYMGNNAFDMVLWHIKWPREVITILYASLWSSVMIKFGPL